MIRYINPPMALFLIILIGLLIGVAFAATLIITTNLIEKGAEANLDIVRQQREVKLVRNLLKLQRRNQVKTDTIESDLPRYDNSLEQLIDDDRLDQAEQFARERLALAHDSNDSYRDNLYRDYLLRIEKLRGQMDD